MWNVELAISLAELNRILFISFGIWFTLVCVYKMIKTAIRVNLPEDVER